MRRIPRSVRATAAVFAACAFFLILLLPLWHQKKAASDRLRTLQKQADAVIAQADTVIALKQSSRETAPGAGETLFSEVDGITVHLGIRPAVASIKPSDIEENGTLFERVTITISGLYQQKGVAFLHALENSGRGILVEQCAIRRSRENLWGMTLTVRRPSGVPPSGRP